MTIVGSPAGRPSAKALPRGSMLAEMTRLWQISPCRGPGVGLRLEADLEYVARWPFWSHPKITASRPDGARRAAH